MEDLKIFVFMQDDEPSEYVAARTIVEAMQCHSHETGTNLMDYEPTNDWKELELEKYFETCVDSDDPETTVSFTELIARFEQPAIIASFE